MSRTRLIAGGIVAALLAGLACAGAVTFRRPLSWFAPIEHTGKVMRIAEFSKGGWNARSEDTRQLRQFVIVFEDGFDCEGFDTSFAAVREGDVITLRGYHDVEGTPLLDPEWWECDEAQLVRLFPPDQAPDARPTPGG